MKQRHWIAAAGIAAIILVYVTAFGPRKHKALQEAPLGMRLNRAETIERARAVAGHLWPNLQNIQVSPEFTEVKLGVSSPYNPAESITAAWVVSCDDAHGGMLGTIIWNARTGDLMSIVAGSSSAIGSTTAYPRIKPSEVHKILKQWMKELTLPEQKAPWREVSEKIASNVVTSEWVAKDRIAQLHVNPTSGELITFRTTKRAYSTSMKLSRLN